MYDKNQIKKISKLLSYILRHRPEKFGISLDNNGWADIQEVLNNCQKEFDFVFDIDLLKHVVATNDKQRFKLSSDFTKIKANQGHSVKVDLGLSSITPPDELYHGTAQRFLDSIMKSGLNRMNRHHVHLYGKENLEKAKNTGSRHQKDIEPVVLLINAKKMFQEGYEFFKTDNNVYLVDKVPSKFIKKHE